MKWNWQQSEWPHFKYKKSEIEVLEKRFLQESGVLGGSFKHINDTEKAQLTVDLISIEALKTSEIEGEYLNRDSVQSSMRRHFGLDHDNRRISAAERGITDMMLGLHKSFDEKLSHKTLFTWHEMLCSNRKDLYDIGAYRTHEDPMQVVSGPLHKQNVHFEAPTSFDVKKEMDEFVKWFTHSKGEISPLIRASISHLYFVCIHPFEDWNGRIGRAIVEKTLAEHLGHPTLISLSSVIEKNKKRYYDMLELSNKNIEITEWIKYFANVILDAQSETQSHVEFLIEKTKFFDKFKEILNKRQKKAIMRLFDAGPNGFEGGLSADNYRSITGATSATASRDLRDLVDKTALAKTGELKSTRYYLNV